MGCTVVGSLRPQWRSMGRKVHTTLASPSSAVWLLVSTHYRNGPTCDRRFDRPYVACVCKLQWRCAMHADQAGALPSRRPGQTSAHPCSAHICSIFCGDADTATGRTAHAVEGRAVTQPLMHTPHRGGRVLRQADLVRLAVGAATPPRAQTCEHRALRAGAGVVRTRRSHSLRSQGRTNNSHHRSDHAPSNHRGTRAARCTPRRRSSDGRRT